MENTFYLLRHGESKFNFEKRHQGWMSGNPLTINGSTQAEKASIIFNNHNIDIIYSSPLLRTKQTARVIANKIKGEVSYSKNLLDFRRSKAQEGLFVHEYIDMPEFKMWTEASRLDSNFALSDGESRAIFSSRVIKFISKINNRFVRKNILLVTHTDVIKEIIRHLTTKSINVESISNCSIIKVASDQEYTILN